jgi:hypothetical protein
MNRHDYLLHPELYAKSGFDLPQTVLPAAAIQEIRNYAAIREQMRKEITEKYSNDAMAKKWSVHRRTIEKVLSYETHKGVK